MLYVIISIQSFLLLTDLISSKNTAPKAVIFLSFLFLSPFQSIFFFREFLSSYFFIILVLLSALIFYLLLCLLSYERFWFRHLSTINVSSWWHYINRCIRCTKLLWNLLYPFFCLITFFYLNKMTISLSYILLRSFSWIHIANI